MKRAIATFVLAISPAPMAQTQTLARPGWVGSGLNVQPWWKHAVIYEIDTRSFQDSNSDGVGDLKGIASHLDYLKTLGVDAILLDSLTPKTANTSVPIDPVFGTIDDFDDLSREASRHAIRLVISLGQSGAASDPNLLPLARYWLNRGAAGVRVNAAAGADSMSSLHRLVSTYAGQRVLITDGNVANASQQTLGGLAVNSALLSIKAASPSSTPNITGTVRLAMEQTQTVPRGTTPLLVSDATGLARSVDRFAGGSHNAGVAKIVGAILLLNRSASQIYLGQELGLHSSADGSVAMPWGTQSPVSPESETVTAKPVSTTPATAPPVVSDKYVPYVAPIAAAKVATQAAQVPLDPATAAGQDADPHSVLNFYRQLTRLHHGNSALRDGEQIMLNHDDQNALIWVRKTTSVTPLTPAIVIVCNLSSQPLVVPLKAELAKLHLSGSFLKTILRSDSGMGSMHLDPVVVPAFGVYVGELRY